MVATLLLHQELLAYRGKDLQAAQLLAHHQRHLAVLVVAVAVQLGTRMYRRLQALAAQEQYQQLQEVACSTLVVAGERRIRQQPILPLVAEERGVVVRVGHLLLLA
jgi:hypothetical protein